MAKINFLEPKEINCRIQKVYPWGIDLLLYITSRAAQSKLDEKYGALGWMDSYSEIGGELYCTIAAYDEKSGVWVKKSDVGIESSYQKVKGRASDAFKRACVKHGIGRELYSAPKILIPKAVCNIKEKDGKLLTKDAFYVNRITYNAYGEIDALRIVNQDLEIVFEQYPSEKIDTNKYKTVVAMAEEAGVSQEKILEMLNIDSIKNMDINQFVKICRKLEVTIEQKKAG